MGIVSGFAGWVRGNYQFGRQASNMLTRNMEPEKARRTGAAVDVLAGTVLTGYMGLQTVGSIAAVSTAILGIATGGVAILPALATIAVGTVFGAMSALMTGMGVGFLSAAKQKLHIPGPKAAVVGVGHGIGWTAHQVARPFKWTGRKLSHVFKRAHDGDAQPGAQPNPNNGLKPGRHSL